MICGVSARLILMRLHHTIPVQQAILCGTLIGLAYGLVGSASLRRRAEAASNVVAD